MITTGNFGALMGAPVLGPDDEKVGTVGQIFVDPVDGHPNWMTIKTGWFGRLESFVPLDTAEWDDETVHINYAKDFIRGAPRIATDAALGEEEEDELYRYYGMSHDADEDRRGSGVVSSDATAGSPSAYMDAPGRSRSDRATGSGYENTGLGRHVAGARDDRPRMRRYRKPEAVDQDDQAGMHRAQEPHPATEPHSATEGRDGDDREENG